MLLGNGQVDVTSDDRSGSRSIGEFFSRVLDVIRNNKGKIQVAENQSIEPQEVEVIDSKRQFDPTFLARQKAANRILASYRQAANRDPRAWDDVVGQMILAETDLVLLKKCQCGQNLTECMGAISGIAIDRAWALFGEKLYREFGPIFPYYCIKCHVLIFSEDKNIRRTLHQRLVCSQMACLERYVAKHKMAIVSEEKKLIVSC